MFVRLSIGDRKSLERDSEDIAVILVKLDDHLLLAAVGESDEMLGSLSDEFMSDCRVQHF
jgi:hypothetical protein